MIAALLLVVLILAAPIAVIALAGWVLAVTGIATVRAVTAWQHRRHPSPGR